MKQIQAAYSCNVGLHGEHNQIGLFCLNERAGHGLHMVLTICIICTMVVCAVDTVYIVELED